MLHSLTVLLHNVLLSILSNKMFCTAITYNVVAYCIFVYFIKLIYVYCNPIQCCCIECFCLFHQITCFVLQSHTMLLPTVFLSILSNYMFFTAITYNVLHYVFLSILKNKCFVLQSLTMLMHNVLLSFVTNNMFCTAITYNVVAYSIFVYFIKIHVLYCNNIQFCCILNFCLFYQITSFVL